MRAHNIGLSLVSAGAVALALAPVGNATDADAAFLAAVAHLGLQFGTAEEAVEAGNNVCDVVAEGSANNVDPARIRADIIANLLGEGVDEYQATHLMTAAVSAYCPTYDHVVTG
ncbi:DUF732 domain-containing protein [Mycobacterium sp. EPG1]|nr:DUF732 domain-containing protein [Mycobacterium sp. EPG1]